MNKMTSEKIIFLNFLMSCFMVCYHTISINDSYALNTWDVRFARGFGNVFSVMGSFAMCYFFFITAYLLFRNYELKDYKRKMKRRFFSLLIPYVAWQIIITFIDILQKQYIFEKTDFLFRTFLIQKYPLDGPLWYVLAIFLLALISPILLLMLKEKKVGWGFIMIVSILTQVMYKLPFKIVQDILQFGVMDNVIYYLPCYLVGAFYGKYEENLHPQNLLGYILLLLGVSYFLEGFIPSLFGVMTKMMLPVFMFFLIPSFNNFKLLKVYNLTFLMYAIHQPLINDLWDGMFKFYIKQNFSVTVYNVGSRFVILLLTLSVSALIYFILSCISPMFLGILTGGRQTVVQRNISTN